MTTSQGIYADLAPSGVAIGNTGSAVTIADAGNDALYTATLTANCTFTLPTAAAGKIFRIALTQDATGSRTATFTGAKYAAATAPTLSTAATKKDILSFLSDGTSWFNLSATLDVR